MNSTLPIALYACLAISLTAACRSSEEGLDSQSLDTTATSLTDAPTALTGELSLDPIRQDAIDLVADRGVVGQGAVQVRSWISGGESAPIVDVPFVQDYGPGEEVRIRPVLSQLGQITSPGVLVVVRNEAMDEIRFAVEEATTDKGATLTIPIASELWLITDEELEAIESASDPIDAAFELLKLLPQPKLSGKSGFRKVSSSGQTLELHNGVAGDQLYVDLLQHQPNETIKQYWIWRTSHATSSGLPNWVDEPQSSGHDVKRIERRQFATPPPSDRVQANFGQAANGIVQPGHHVGSLMVVHLKVTNKPDRYYQYRLANTVPAGEASYLNWEYYRKKPIKPEDIPAEPTGN